MVTAAGFSLLSLALITFIVHTARVQEKIRSNEEYARDTGRDLAVTLGRAGTVAEVAAQTLRGNPGFPADLQTGKTVLPVPALLQLSDASGMAVVVGGRVFPLAGSLDPTATDAGWNEQRWAALNVRIRGAVQQQDKATVFLGLERVYRSQRELEEGAQRFDGSLVLVNAWRDTRFGWAAVVVLLPVRSLTRSLHLGRESEYLSGDYDYLVDCDGSLLLHPRPFLVTGTTLDGRAIHSATKQAEVGIRPLNTRDADWIAGGKMLSEAFNNAILENQPRSVVYKNLQRQNRLTSFRRIDLPTQGIDGCLGVVAGKGLHPFEAITTPLLLHGPSSLLTVLNVIVAIFGLLLTAWITFTMKLRSLHGDLLAWGRHVSASTAEVMKLLPIRNAPAEPQVYNDMVGVVVTLNISPTLSSATLAEMFNEFGGIAMQLREDGWIVSNWSLRSFFISRRLREGPDSPYPWTPQNVVNYLRHVKSPETGESLFRGFGARSCRATYALGELRVDAARVGAIRRAVISFFGSALTDTLVLEDQAGENDPEQWWGWMVYDPVPVKDAGIDLAGEAFTTPGGRFRRLPLHLESGSLSAHAAPGALP
jgi:hypothetical protein